MSRKEKNNNTGASPWQLAWKRFRKNKLAFAGLIYLAICVFVAIFAYAFMPDNTHNANFRILEYAKQPPGTHINLLLKPIHTEVEQPGWLARIFTGRPDIHSPIPLEENASVQVSGDTLRYTTFQGLQEQTFLPVFMLDIHPSHPKSLEWKETEGRPYELRGNQIKYIDAKGEWGLAFLNELEQQITGELTQERVFRLGSDGSGRDVLSRLLLGARVSLSVGLMAVLVSLFLGILMGSLAGFFRGWVDSVIMWFVSVIWSIPVLLLAISLSFVMGEGFWQLFLAIGIATWVEVARIVRGQIFALRELQFIEATRVMGFRTFRVIFRHVLPNIMSPIIIIAAANFAAAILIEAGLSFLGVGVKSPIPSWGTMIQEGYTQIFFDSGSWLAFFPGLAIVLVVISLNLVGFGLRDALDPKYEM